MRILMTIIIAITLAGCGATEKEKLQTVQNMEEMMWDFQKGNPLPRLYDDDITNGGISFSFDPDGTDIYIEIFYLKNKNEIDKIKKKIISIIKSKNIKNNVYMRFYSKAEESGKGQNHQLSYSSEDCYKTLKIN